MSNMKVLMNGIIKENPTFVLLLGMCPTLGTTSSALNGMSMGLATMFVLICSNIAISLLKKVIPDTVRIPCYIVVIASFVTLVQFLVKAYLPDLDKALGVYLPLIVVNCIILGRAETYASKYGPFLSAFDGVGIGLGFTFGLTVIGMVRELIGNGTIFNMQIMPESYEPISIFVMAPGAFFVLSILCMIQNKLKLKGANRHVKGEGGCSGNCETCPAAGKEVEKNE